MYQLRPEDILGCFGDYKNWKLRVEYYTLPDQMRRYVDYDLVDSIANNYYAVVEEPIQRNPTVPSNLSYLVHTTAYFYNTETKEVVIVPAYFCTRVFEIKNPTTARTINIP